jgi:hypothetical protein
MLQSIICLHKCSVCSATGKRGEKVTNTDKVSMISLKWRYKKDVVILSTYRGVEEDVNVCRGKQLFRSLFKSTREGSEQLKKCYQTKTEEPKERKRTKFGT